jgi:hypothetical protein
MAMNCKPVPTLDERIDNHRISPTCTHHHRVGINRSNPTFRCVEQRAELQCNVYQSLECQWWFTTYACKQGGNT